MTKDGLCYAIVILEEQLTNESKYLKELIHDSNTSNYGTHEEFKSWIDTSREKIKLLKKSIDTMEYILKGGEIK